MSKILLIDDSADNLTSLSATLKDFIPTSTILTALSGQEGLKIASSKLPDVIILDIRMPGMDGYEVLGLLKANVRTKIIPVILLTANYTDIKSKVRGLEAGADAFLSKPIDKNELIAQIKVMLRIKKAEDMLRNKNILLKSVAKDASMKFDFSQKKYQNIFDNNIAGIVETTFEGEILSCNTALAKMFGFKNIEEILKHKSIPFYKNASDRDKIISLLKKNKRLLNYEVDFVDKNGKTINALVRCFNIGDQSVLTFLIDITDIKKLQETQNQYEHIVSSSIDMMALLDKNFSYLACNSAYLEAFGKTSEELIGFTVEDVFGKEFFETVIKPNALRCLSGKVINYQKWFDFPTKGKCYMDISYYPHKDKQNKIKGFIVNARDITERREKERQIIESEKKYRSLFNSMLNGFAYCRMIFDENNKPIDWIYLEINDAFTKITGLKKDIVGKTVTEAIPGIKDDVPELFKSYGKVASSGEETKFEIYLDTLKIWFSVMAYRPKKDHFVAVFEDITERKMALKRLKESEERFSMLMQQSPSVIEIYNTDGLQVAVNKVYEKLWGFPASHTLNKFNVLKSKEVKDSGLLEYINRAYKGESVSVPEYKFDSTGQTEAQGLGRIRWLSTKIYPLKDQLENVNNIVITHEDITDRKLAEKALKESEERLNAFFNQSLDGFFFRMLDEPVIWNDSVDKEKILDYVVNHLRFTKINSAMLEQYGAAEKDFIGLTLNDLDFVDTKSSPRERMRDLFDKGHFHIDTTEKKLDGTDIIIEGDYLCLYDSQKRITGHFGIQRDVTDVRNTEIELKKNKKELQDFFDGDISGNYISTPEGQLLRCNKTFLKMFGFKSEKEALKYSLEKLYLDETERDSFVDIIRMVKKVNLFDRGFVTLDGRKINVLENAVGVFNKDGELIKIRGHLMDITERVIALKEIRKYQEHLEELVDEKTKQLTEQNSFLKTLLDTIPNPVFLLNKDRKITLVNKSFENFFAIKRELILGKSISNIIPPDVEELSKKYDKKLLKKYDSVVYESFVIINKSEKIPVMIFKSSYGSEGLKPQGITCLVVDISEQKKMEEQTLESLKKEKELNEMKTNFISMASHEFRTPLTTILASADLLEMFHNKWDEGKNILHIKKIQNSVLYMTSLLNDVLTMSRSDRGKMSFNPSLINLEDFCGEIIEQTKLQAKPNHNIIYQYKLPYQNVKIDPKLLNHILTNLLINAFKFSPNGGDVVLSVEDMKKFIKFSIKDEGIGIPEDEINKLFEPFFRGKNSSNIEGTGLGLSIVKRYVELHKGEISLDSKLGKGTQFYIKIKKQ